jgi:hypothetical protein
MYTKEQLPFVLLIARVSGRAASLAFQTGTRQQVSNEISYPDFFYLFPFAFFILLNASCPS